MHECQIQGLLPNLESLERFLHQYVTQNLFDNEKQTQLYKKTLKLHPYLNPKYNQISNPSRFCNQKGNGRTRILWLCILCECQIH